MPGFLAPTMKHVRMRGGTGGAWSLRLERRYRQLRWYALPILQGLAMQVGERALRSEGMMTPGFLETVVVLLIVGWLFGLSRLLRMGIRGTWIVAVVGLVLIVVIFAAEEYRGR